MSYELVARYEGPCPACGQVIKKGSPIVKSKAHRKYKHAECSPPKKDADGVTRLNSSLGANPSGPLPMGRSMTGKRAIKRA